MLKNNTLYVFVFFFAISSAGQDLNTSPFSRYGIGELNTIQSAHYFGFGNISSALSEPQNININNPASYASFIQYNPIFNVSLSGKSALYNSNYNGKETNSTGNNFGLNTLFIGLPIKKNWGLVFGITPISSQGYNITNTVPFESSTVSYLYKGDGSINKLMIGNGFNFINKGDTTRLAFGINCSYLFGNLERTSSVIYNNSNNYNNSRIQYRSSLSGWSFDLGLQFYKKIETSSKNKLILNLGLNYVLGSDLISDNDFFAYSFIYNFNVQEIAKDTIEMSNEISSMVIPQKLDVGIAIGKIYKNIRRWDLGIQYSNTDWSNFNDNSTYSTQTDFPMGASSRISFGYRLSPNLDWANSNKSLISKSTYSFGLHQTKSQIIVDNESLINNGINFGVSIPMLNSRSLSRINFGFEFGKLGDLKSNNIEENYFKFSIGFSLGPDTRYDRWFRKRKYD
jgi:hypothetical protein